MGKKHSKALWWVKRDFRLVDNEAYALSLQESEDVLPCFAYEPLLLDGPDWGRFHTYALRSGQKSLRGNLRAFGSDLYVSTEDVIPMLETIKASYDFTAIYAHEETGLAHTFERDMRVAAWCAERRVAFVEVRNNGVIRKLKNRDAWERKFKEYITAPQAHLPRSLTLSNDARALAAATEDLAKESLKIDMLSEDLQPVSEAAAHDVLKGFLSRRSQGYSGGISSMNRAVMHSSHLSPHLAWGTISLRHVFQATERMREELALTNADYRWQRSLTSFKSRLYWHAHFVQKLEDEVGIEKHAQNAAFETGLPWVVGEELSRRLKAWETGTTGFPMIDASMRHFRKHGWLNFRSRSMVASFAMHALRIDWKVILYRLAPYMIDYVPGIHAAQVQMQAGVTGSNTIRVYSPMKQMQDHDPDAEFIKSSIPELAQFTAKEIADFQDRELGAYPRPIIDFKVETKLMKDALYGIKKSTFGREEAQRVYRKHGSRRRPSWVKR